MLGTAASSQEADQPLQTSICSFCPSLLSLPHKSSRKWGGRQDYVWLIWGQLLVSLENQMKEEDQMSKRCERQHSLEGWEASGWWAPTLFLAGSQCEPGGNNLPHTCSVWSLDAPLSGCSAFDNPSCSSLLCLLLWQSERSTTTFTGSVHSLPQHYTIPLLFCHI